MLPDFLEKFASDLNRTARFARRLSARLEELFRVYEVRHDWLAEWGGPLVLTYTFATPEAVPPLALVQLLVDEMRDFNLPVELERATPDLIGEECRTAPLHYCCYLQVAVQYIGDAYIPRPGRVW